MQSPTNTPEPQTEATRKHARRKEIESSRTYRLTQQISKWMGNYYLDPIIGFLLPGGGDIVTGLFIFPYLYISIFKLRSLPLTLAIIYNILFDILVGMIPAHLGDVIDIFNKAYVKNSRLLTGFVEGDTTVIREVNRKAILFGILILLIILLIYLLILLILQIGTWIGSAYTWLWGLF